MANQILAGAVIQAGQVIAGVDANNPPYVGPPAHWAETQYGVGGGGGGAWSNGSSTAIQFNVMQNDTSGVDILTDIANNLDNNEVFKIEFRNSNKVVHSYDSPHRIIMNPNAPRDVPFYESTYYKSWQLNIMTEGSEAGNQHSPAKTLFDTYNPVNGQDVSAPEPSGAVDPTGATNLNDLASFDQVIFYNQSGNLIDHINLSSTRTGNGFDADGSASQATSLTSVVNPTFPTFERLVFRSRSQGPNAQIGVHLVDPVTMVAERLTDPASVNQPAWGYAGSGNKLASTPDGSYFFVSDTSDYDGGTSETSTTHGAVHVYNARNLSAGPIHTFRLENTKGHNFGSTIIASNTHLFVGAPGWFPGQYDDYADSAARRVVQEGKVYKYDLSDFSASPEAIDSPRTAAANVTPAGIQYTQAGDPRSPGFGNSMYGGGGKIFIVAAWDLTGHTVVGQRIGGGNVYVYDEDNVSTGQHTHRIMQNGWDAFGEHVAVDVSDDAVWFCAAQPQHNYDTYTNDHGSIWKYSLSDLSAAPTVVANPEDFRGSAVGGSNWDRFGQKIVFTDTKLIISSAHEYEDFPQNGYRGYIYIMNKDGSQKQTLTNLPPNHREDWTVFGRYMQAAAGKLFITRYSPYGQDTSPGGYFPDGNGELWIYDLDDLGAAPVLWNEAGTSHANEEVIDSEMVVMNLQL